MKILITGGGGFLGSEIVRQLLPKGHGLTIMARSQYPSIEALGVKCIQADIQNQNGLIDHLKGIAAPAAAVPLGTMPTGATVSSGLRKAEWSSACCGGVTPHEEAHDGLGTGQPWSAHNKLRLSVPE